ncbi:ABC transporter permease [Actinomyces sp. 186855]|uniref:ABC transporter permease n=1 Tax=Actinomyces sp. 186855 TaxID=2761164 RepID=UPI002016FDAF|nr:ABC transporter permease [Actinomyces sp. 186855]MCL3791699.1 ABC transporter permease [Actinomyces sp. 186855]
MTTTPGPLPTSPAAGGPAPAAGGLSWATAVRLEVAKTRRLRLWPVALALLGVCLALSLPVSASARDHLANAVRDPWPDRLLTVSMSAALVSPLLVSVLASRLVDVEHTGGGWNLSATMGLTPGRLCRAKLTALAGVLAPVVVLQVALPVVAGRLVGATWALDTAPWLAYGLSLFVLDVVACGLHLLLAALVDNQIICVGVGFLGSFISLFALLMPPWLTHLVPWGYWAAITPAVTVGDLDDGAFQVVYTSPDWPWVIGFLLLAATTFAAATARLDRIER